MFNKRVGPSVLPDLDNHTTNFETQGLYSLRERLTEETQECLVMHPVDSPEEGVDDDLYEEDPRIVESHSRIDDLTDYLWSIRVIIGQHASVQNVCGSLTMTELGMKRKQAYKSVVSRGVKLTLWVGSMLPEENWERNDIG